MTYCHVCGHVSNQIKYPNKLMQLHKILIKLGMKDALAKQCKKESKTRKSISAQLE